MTLIEFYENYFTINGEKPPPLTDFQRMVLKAWDEVKSGGGNVSFVLGRGRRHSMQTLYNCVKEKVKQDEQPKKA